MADNDISPELRVMLIEWRAASIRQANSIGQLLGLDIVRTEREHVRRSSLTPRQGGRMVTRGDDAPGT